MKIGLDVDGVLANFNAAFIQRVITVTGIDKFPPRPFDIPTWNYPEHYGYERAHTSATWESIKADANFWATLPDYDETQIVLDSLWLKRLAGHDVYFITNRMGINAKHQTERWLASHRYDNPTVLLSERKGMICGGLTLDFYIDDKYENVVDVQEQSHTKAFLLNRPWNTGYDVGSYNITRVDSVLDFLLQAGQSVTA